MYMRMYIYLRYALFLEVHVLRMYLRPFLFDSDVKRSFVSHAIGDSD